jgi:hypothetical protein
MLHQTHRASNGGRCAEIMLFACISRNEIDTELRETTLAVLLQLPLSVRVKVLASAGSIISDKPLDANAKMSKWQTAASSQWRQSNLSMVSLLSYLVSYGGTVCDTLLKEVVLPALLHDDATVGTTTNSTTAADTAAATSSTTARDTTAGGASAVSSDTKGDHDHTTAAALLQRRTALQQALCVAIAKLNVPYTELLLQSLRSCNSSSSDCCYTMTTQDEHSICSLLHRLHAGQPLMTAYRKGAKTFAVNVSTVLCALERQLIR